MKFTSRLITALRGTALVLLVAGIATWVATGAHRGWTQTSRVTLQRDDITGIDYPVREEAFTAGVEIPVGGAIAAAAIAGLSFLPRRRSVAA